MQERDRAWLAGLFEGEGSWAIQRIGPGSRYKREYRYPRAVISSCDLDVLVRARTIVGGGTIQRKPRYSEKHSPAFDLVMASRRDFSRLVVLILPFLCQRRRSRLDEVLESAAT